MLAPEGIFCRAEQTLATRGREWSNHHPARRGEVMEKFKACSFPGVHRALGASAPGGLHPRPTARHQRWRCHLPLGFPGSACGEVTPSRVSAPCRAVPSPAARCLPCPIPAGCNAGPFAFPGLLPPSPLCCREQVSLPPRVS